MRAVLVVNPRATSTSAAGRDVLARALSSVVALDLVETDYRGHATAAAAQARIDGADLVVAHGGDGTVNEVVNGLLAAGTSGKVPMLGVVPGGSANVFARALGLPRDPIEAAHQLVLAIVDSRSRRVGLGHVGSANGDTLHDGRWFTFNAGVGWDADVVAGVDRRRGKRASTALYARIALLEYLRPAHGGPDLTIELPGEAPIGGLKLAFVSNADPWTYLGDRPIHLNPECTFDNGLGLFALRTLRMPTVLRHLRQALSTRARLRGGQLIRRDDVPHVRVTTRQPVRLQCDGDLIGERTRVDFQAVPDVLSVVL